MIHLGNKAPFYKWSKDEYKPQPVISTVLREAEIHYNVLLLNVWQHRAALGMSPTNLLKIQKLRSLLRPAKAVSAF